jgi:hypothetical protein
MARIVRKRRMKYQGMKQIMVKMDVKKLTDKNDLKQ